MKPYVEAKLGPYVVEKDDDQATFRQVNVSGDKVFRVHSI